MIKRYILCVKIAREVSKCAKQPFHMSKSRSIFTSSTKQYKDISFFKIKLFALCEKENTVVTGLFIKIYDARNRIKIKN